MIATQLKQASLWLVVVPPSIAGLIHPVGSRRMIIIAPSSPSQLPRSCFHRRRRRNIGPTFSMASLDEDVVPVKEKGGINEDAHHMSSNSDADENNDNGRNNDRKQNLALKNDADIKDNITSDYENQDDIIYATTNEGMTNDSNLIDNFWSWALQTSLSEPGTPRRRPRQSNRRMQVFQYLSQPSKPFYVCMWIHVMSNRIHIF